MKITLRFKLDSEIKLPSGRVMTFKKDDTAELNSYDFGGAEEALKKVVQELLSHQAAIPGGPQVGPVVRMHDGGE